MTTSGTSNLDGKERRGRKTMRSQCVIQAPFVISTPCSHSVLQAASHRRRVTSSTCVSSKSPWTPAGNCAQSHYRLHPPDISRDRSPLLPHRGGEFVISAEERLCSRFLDKMDGPIIQLLGVSLENSAQSPIGTSVFFFERVGRGREIKINVEHNRCLRNTRYLSD